MYDIENGMNEWTSEQALGSQIWSARGLVGLGLWGCGGRPPYLLCPTGLHDIDGMPH
jgi:hypothetical protein